VAASPHRIRRQRFRVGARSAAEAFDVRQRFTQGLETVQSALSRAFDALVPGDEIVHLPRLEIRARVRSFDELVEVLPELVQREALALLEKDAATGPPPVAAPQGHTAEAPPTGNALLHYVRTGSLAWTDETWSRAKNTALFLGVSLEESRAVLGALPLPQLDETTVSTVFRLLQTLPEALWAELASGFFAERPVFAAPRPPAASLPERPTATHVAQAIAAIATSSLPRHTRLWITATLIVAARTASAPASTSLTALVSRALGPSRTSVDIVEILPPAARPVWQYFALTTAAESPPVEASRSDTARPLPGPSVPSAAEPARQWITTVRSHEEPAPGLVVSCAGLVLVHPFVARFFEATGVTQGFVRELEEPQLPRAAALLHHLVTGAAEPLEHELGLIKPLLGLSPHEPLSVGGGLVTDADREEAERLLEAVVSHWGALGRTSAASFRSTFLDRSGLLRETDDGLRLHVEPAPFDMLLDRLPWAISVVKLPWMRKAIFTEWPTL
jgi:hypothetical protein